MGLGRVVGAAAATAAVGVAWVLLLTTKRRRREAEEEAAELGRLLALVRALDMSTFYVVSNAKGDTFSRRGLETHCRNKGILAATAVDGVKNSRQRPHASSAPREKTPGCNRRRARSWPCSNRAPREGAARLPSRQTTTAILHRSARAYGPSGKVRLKHALARARRLVEKYDEMCAAYVQQPLDYGRNSRYGDKWRISCYLVVLEKWMPKIEAHGPMVACLGGVMADCAAAFEAWYARQFDLARCEATVMNCFLTRYRPQPEEDELQRHIDGANVDGSVILALPTKDPYAGGELKVWDAKREFTYTMAPGDCIFLDTKVWHQATPITSGERWALVLFLRLKKTPREFNSGPPLREIES